MSNISRAAGQSQFSLLLQPTTPFLVLAYSIAIIAILLNSIEIKLIMRQLKRATDFEIVLLNLAIADLLNSVLFVVVTVKTQMSTNIKEIRYNDSVHWLMGILAFSVTASVSFVGVIGIERFFAIKVPLQHRLWHMSRKRLIKYIISTWLFDVILIATLSIVDYLRQRNDPNSISAIVAYFVAGLLTFGTALILVLYTWVLHLMIMRSVKLFDFDKKILRVNSKMIKEAMKKEKSSITICTLIVVSFVVCNIPLIIDLFQLQVTMTSAILLKLSAVDNPLFYFFKSHLERYYAKKRLDSSYTERSTSREKKSSSQGSNGVTMVTEKKYGSDGVDCDERSLAKEDIIFDVIENAAVIVGDEEK